MKLFYLFIIPFLLVSVNTNAKESNFEFINFPGLFQTKNLDLSLDYTENFVFYWFLMEHHGEHTPSFHNNVQYNTKRGLMVYNRMYLEFGRAVIPRIHNQRGDEFLTRKVNVNYIKSIIRLKETKYTNINLSFLSFDWMLGITFSKRINDFYYSLGYQKHIMFFGIIHKPDMISVAYRPIDHFWLFNEFKSHKNDGRVKSGYMNLAGIRWDYKFISLSFFYNILYDDNDLYTKGSDFERHNNRYGVQIKLFH